MNTYDCNKATTISNINTNIIINTATSNPNVELIKVPNVDHDAKLITAIPHNTDSPTFNNTWPAIKLQNNRTANAINLDMNDNISIAVNIKFNTNPYPVIETAAIDCNP